MTQDVQPLTWQKRTNLEEHQQFFSKINEIIDNLAPTVDEAEQAIAQATAAIASANDAVATANAASAAASAAASQAQTAASVVAGYDTRLTAAEGDIGTNTADITALQGRMGTAEGKITAIEGREADYLKKTGAAQTVTSQIMVPTTATGVRDTQIANGSRVQNDLDAYAPMVRNTGNQTKAGKLTMSTPQGLECSALAKYNNILLESTSQSNRFISRVRNAAGDLHDQHFDLGTTYSTSVANNVNLRAFAPREVFGDESEGQARLSLSIHVENNDTGYVELVFTKKDGANKTMRIGTFDGTNWS